MASLLKSVASPRNLKPEILVVGSGWAGYTLARQANKALMNVTLLSPRNHFLFTPLLTTTTVGTLEFRNICEPVRNIKNLLYYQATCNSLNLAHNRISCLTNDNSRFDLSYDALVLALGAESNTFKIKGVCENCFFMKQISDASAIRSKIISLFESTNLPNVDEMTKRERLTFVIVGAGPASIEFSAELYDFIVQEASRLYPHFKDYLRIYIVEAMKDILGMFHPDLRLYARKTFSSRNIHVLTGTAVTEVNRNEIILSDGQKIKTGMIVWNTGNKQTPFVESVDLLKEGRSQRLVIDEYCRVSDSKGNIVKNVFALGDCAVNGERALPPTAQVAYQQADWLARSLNGKETGPFKYVHRGTLAYIGDHKALADTGLWCLKGTPAWIFWNLVYIAKLFSLKSKIMVPLQWFINYLFGRSVVQLK